LFLIIASELEIHFPTLKAYKNITQILLVGKNNIY